MQPKVRYRFEGHPPYMKRAAESLGVADDMLVAASLAHSRRLAASGSDAASIDNKHPDQAIELLSNITRRRKAAELEAEAIRILECEVTEAIKATDNVDLGDFDVEPQLTKTSESDLQKQLDEANRQIEELTAPTKTEGKVKRGRKKKDEPKTTEADQQEEDLPTADEMTPDDQGDGGHEEDDREERDSDPNTFENHEERRDDSDEPMATGEPTGDNEPADNKPSGFFGRPK